MQQILTNKAENQTGFIPFSFDAVPEESLAFANILQKNINNLENIEELEKINADFAQKIDLIKETIPTDETIKITLEKANNDETDEEQEIPSQAVVLINLVNGYLEKNIELMKNLGEIKQEMRKAGFSEENIANTLKILDQDQDNKPNGLNTENALLNPENKQAKTNIDQSFIEKFTTNSQDIKSLLSESILMGKEINKLQQDISQQNIAKTTNTEAVTNTENTNNLQNNQEASSQKTDSKISEILNLFKQADKSDLSKINIDNLNIQNANKLSANQQVSNNEAIKATTDLQTNNSDKNIQLLGKDVIANQQATPINPKAKTHGEINKSEYKELASKFIDKMADEQLKPITEKTENTNTTEDASIFMPINTQTKKLNIKENTLAQNIENIEVADSTKTDTSSDDIKTNDAKPLASNFNMHLYKLAQQTNIQNQITLAIRNLRDSNTQQLKIKLNPEELGSISIDMEMVNNVAKGIITVEKSELAKHLAQNLNKMFDSFKQAGFNLNTDNIVVKIDNNSNQQDSQFTKKDSNNNETDQVINLNEEIIDIKI